MDVSIIIPTYKEAENLQVLIPRITEALQGTGLNAEMIVVDDNSPDATVAVCNQLAHEHPLRLIVRTNERGLSSAVIAGMHAAQGEILLVMDADLSHPPEKIPELIQALRDPHVDFVIGSRYVSGGTTTDDWGLFRWLNSKAATLLARPLTTANDPMAGFFAVRTRTFAEHAARLDPIGYKIALELIVKCRCQRVVEVPILFRDRLHGESKLTLREQLNYLRHLKRLYDFRYGIWAYLLQFCVVGLTGLIVDLSLYAILLQGLNLPVARGLAIWGAMTWNFWLNRNVTFSFSRQEPWFRQYLSFCGSCVVGAAVNWSTSLVLSLSSTVFQEQRLAAAACGVIADGL